TTTSLLRGNSTVMFRRLFSRAPWMRSVDRIDSCWVAFILASSERARPARRPGFRAGGSLFLPQVGGLFDLHPAEPGEPEGRGKFPDAPGSPEPFAGRLQVPGEELRVGEMIRELA